MYSAENLAYATFFAATSVSVLILYRTISRINGCSERSNSLLVSTAGAVGFLAIWWLLSAMRPEGITRIPSPLSTAIALWSMFADGTLPKNVALSFGRVLVGFSLAASIGVALGWLAGTFFIFNRLLLPTNSFLRYIPPTAFVTLLIVYFGIGESYKFSVVFVSVVFFIIQMTVDAVEDIDPHYREMALLSGMGSVALLRHVVLPSTLPRVVDILRVNISGAWTFLVAAEVIGADGGIGHLIAVSQRFGRIEHMFAAIVVFGAIGISTDATLRVIGYRLFKWAH